MNIQENLSQITVDIVGGGPRQRSIVILGGTGAGVWGGGGGRDKNKGH